MVLKLLGARKQMFWAFEKSIFQFFANFGVTKLKPFSGTVRQSLKNYLNQSLVIRGFLENGFQDTASSKTNVLSVWKGHFPVFRKFLSDEVENLFWEIRAKRLKLFKSKFGHGKLIGKWFWGYRDLKNECSERLIRAFFSFLQIFEWRSRNYFLGQWDKAFQTV